MKYLIMYERPQQQFDKKCYLLFNLNLPLLCIQVMQRKNEVRVFALRFQTRTNLSHAMFLNLAILTGIEDRNICRISFIDLDIYINSNKIIFISDY